MQYSSEPVRGNFFSLDYYSLTPRGKGLLANACITAFKKAYRANLSVIDVNSLSTTARYASGRADFANPRYILHHIRYRRKGSVSVAAVRQAARVSA